MDEFIKLFYVDVVCTFPAMNHHLVLVFCFTEWSGADLVPGFNKILSILALPPDPILACGELNMPPVCALHLLLCLYLGITHHFTTTIEWSSVQLFTSKAPDPGLSHCIQTKFDLYHAEDGSGASSEVIPGINAGAPSDLCSVVSDVPTSAAWISFLSIIVRRIPSFRVEPPGFLWMLKFGNCKDFPPTTALINLLQCHRQNTFNAASFEFGFAWITNQETVGIVWAVYCVVFVVDLPIVMPQIARAAAIFSAAFLQTADGKRKLLVQRMDYLIGGLLAVLGRSFYPPVGAVPLLITQLQKIAKQVGGDTTWACGLEPDWAVGSVPSDGAVNDDIDVIPLVDSVTKLTARCELCGNTCTAETIFASLVLAILSLYIRVDFVSLMDYRFCNTCTKNVAEKNVTFDLQKCCNK